MKRLILLIILAIFIGCDKKHKNGYNEGIYCLKSYLDKDNFDSKYIEYFLIKVTKDKIIQYGTVNTWGNISNRNLNDENKLIINDTTITVLNPINDRIVSQEYIKLKNADQIIDNKGINREEFTKFLNIYLIAGNYKLGNKIVKFRNDGKIENLDSLKTFSINPRFGTNWWYDYRTIKLNEELWKFEFTKKQFILTKYLKPKIEDQAELSDIKIILNR